MKKYNQIIIFILFIASVFINILYIVNTLHYQTLTIKNSYCSLDENIVFFGDSITYKYDIEDYFTNRHVVNKGINGNKTEDLIKRLDDVYTSNPSKVIILIGINDLIKKIEIDDIINDYQIIIDSIKTNRRYAEIYIESVYPINMNLLQENGKEHTYHLTNEKVMELNERLKELAKENDLTYIDVYSKLVDEENNLKELYTTDGLHISHLGYLRITTTLEKYINE